MKLTTRFFIFFLLSFGVTSTPLSAKKTNEITIKVAVNIITYEKYQLHSKLDLCNNFPDFSALQTDRPLVELALACMALKTQGVNLMFEFIPTSGYARSVWLVQKGVVDTFSQSVWQDDIDTEHTYATIDLIRTGEFTKGIYTYKDHELLTMDVEAIDLSKYRGMTQQTWLYDIEILEKLTPDILKNNYFPVMFKILANQRADFTLMEFPSKGSLSIAQDGYELRPIEGIKIKINKARKLIVSKKSKHGEYYFNTLNKGLKELREKGEIHKTYVDTGFINPKTEAWKIIN